MADVDRGYVSQYSQQDVGISIIVASVPTDADSGVLVTVSNDDTQSVLFTARAADHVGVGQYQITLTPDDTAVLGNYTATWSYELSGAVTTFLAYYAVGGAEPAYDRLSDGMKDIVDQVWIMLADLFDSPSGGPNLQTWGQANFNRGRIAQLLPRAIGLLNTRAQPIGTYTIDGVGGAVFPLQMWGALLQQALYVETVKHLRRSYLEQPQLNGGGVSTLDRQSYYDRWGQILQEEQETLKEQLDGWKISQMGLSRPSVLVSGGIFGRYSSVNRPYMAARPRVWFQNFI